MFDAFAPRRARVAATLDLRDALLVVGAGAPVPLPELSDQHYPYRAHAEFFYLAGAEVERGVIAHDPRDGAAAGWRLFAPEVSEAERVWEGRRHAAGQPLGEFSSWLQQRAGRPLALLGTPPLGLVADAAATARARELLTHARRPKDATELDTLRRSARATTTGFAALVAALRPGVSEQTLQCELEIGFRRGGATANGFASIVGTGPNSAVLHFPPGPRVARAGEFVLVDAGAEVDRYVTDVTRTYLVGAPADPIQRDLHALVRAVQEAAIARCRPGVEWRDLHLRCAEEMVTGLVALGLMRGTPSSLIEQDAHTLFFPHGLGHLVGLGVRDASGTPPGRMKDPRPSLQTLRTDLPLAAGYVITVEPGLYFIPPLLDDPVRRERFRDCVHWDRVDALRHLGGVRLEDDVLVTDSEPEVLTAAIPKDLTPAG